MGNFGTPVLGESPLKILEMHFLIWLTSEHVTVLFSELGGADEKNNNGRKT